MVAEHAYTTNPTVISTPIVLTQYDYSNTWKDQFTKITEWTNFVKSKEISYTYDASGNPISMTDLLNSSQSKSLNWDGRQLQSISYYGGGMSFRYNDQGVRTYKSIGGIGGGYSVYYTVNGNQILSEAKGTSTIYYTYDVDGSLISLNYNGNEYFYIINMQGDVVELVDRYGNTVVKYRYDAWGNLVDQDDDSGVGLANANPFRYRSYYYDIETGWYYLQSRYYDPTIGRFLNSDGLIGQVGDIQQHNMYAYCANNPVMHIDSDGDNPVAIIIIIAYLVWEAQDIYDIMSGDVYFEASINGDGGKIVNSYKVQNPSVVIGYSIYLRYFSEHKEDFDGSAAGIAAEWIWHNVGYDITYIPSKFGVWEIYNKRAADADIGRTIFNEKEWYVRYPSIAIETIFSPGAVIYDYFQYIHQSEGDGND